MRWEAIANSLQEVQFKLGQAELLNEAITTTSTANTSYQDTLVASLSAVLAGTATSLTSTRQVDASGMETSTSNSTRTRETPAAPGYYNITIAAPEAQSISSGAATGISAQLKLRAAAALAEEVAIINKRVTSVPMRPMYRAYFISLQLSMQPQRHGLPYDTSILLRFSIDGAHAAGAPGPHVIPLLVTDSFEGTRESDLATVVRQLGVGLKGSNGILGASANLERTLASIEQSEILRPNSLFSIGKVDDAAVRVRLGANRFGTTYEMIPRTHNVSLIVLVPTEATRGPASTIRVSTEVDFTDAMYAQHRSDKAWAGGSSFTIRTVEQGAPTETFVLPAQEAAQCPPLQDVIVRRADFGGGRSASVVSVNGGGGLSQRKMEAGLTTPKLYGGADPIHLISGEFVPDGRTIQFLFPDHSEAIDDSKRRVIDEGRFAFTLAPTLDGEAAVRCPAEARGYYRAVYMVMPPAKSETKPADKPAVVTAKSEGESKPPTPKDDGVKPAQAGQLSAPLRLENVPPPVTIPSS
jgi:hypothetical protein